jgi:C2H2 type zinc-finger (2 copies)
VLFESFEKNLEQMAKKFGFIVYEEKSCVKKQELIKYLAKLIHKENRCIYCDQRFKSGSDVQKHMVSKMHCLMNPEYFGQYEKFYDFSEENRRVALELQERFKHVKSDNQFVYMIKNKPEEDKREKQTEEIRENGSADGSDEEEWEDDEVEEDAEKSRTKSHSGWIC